MTGTFRIALACAAMIAVTCVCISPELDEADELLQVRHLVVSTRGKRASVEQLPAIAAISIHLRTNFVLLHFSKSPLADLTSPRRC
jgi:hypothetical protein